RRLQRPEVGHLTGCSVDRILDVVVALVLLHPSGRQDQELREHRLGEIRRAADGEADHSNSSSFSAASRCLRLSLVGTTTWKTACGSPRPRLPIAGRPSPLSRTESPGWVPAGPFTVLAPSRVGTSISSPSI